MSVAVHGYTSIADSQFDRAEGLQLQSAAACSRHVEASATTCVPSCATDLPARATVAESRQASRSKIIPFSQNFESVVSFARPASLAEGRIEVVTNVRRDAVDAKALADEQRGRGRRSRVVLSVKPFFPRKTHIGTLGTTLGTISRPERAETS
jgi:hypothetical protein